MGVPPLATQPLRLDARKQIATGRVQPLRLLSLPVFLSFGLTQRSGGYRA